MYTKRTHMNRFTIVTALMLVMITLFGAIFYEGTLPVDARNSQPTTVVIPRGAALKTIIDTLDKEGVIRSKLVFYILARTHKKDSVIQAGSFRIRPNMNAYEIIESLSKGSDDVWITIIEGLRKEEIAHEITKELNIPEADFIAQANEGTLFPDTYLFPRYASVDQVLGIFEANYKKKFTPELKEQARAKGLTENQVLTIASMVEREANTPPTMQKVASVIVKRWKNDWPLQIDATVQYILGYQENTGTWWKQRLTKADLDISSPYNTYEHPGLPPAPIASPGLEAIKAVINADPNTPYWFYISNKDGSEMIFSRTVEEHNAAIAKHL